MPFAVVAVATAAYLAASERMTVVTFAEPVAVVIALGSCRSWRLESPYPFHYAVGPAFDVAAAAACKLAAEFFAASMQ